MIVFVEISYRSMMELLDMVILNFIHISLGKFYPPKIIVAEYLWAGSSMPGNEVGDRVHNFFGQENLSQAQHHSQAIHGNWPGLNNNLLAGNQRQIGASFISNLKNYNVQQSGINLLIHCFLLT